MYTLIYGITKEILECESLKDAYRFFIKDSRRAIYDGENWFYCDVFIDGIKKYEWTYCQELSYEDIEEFYDDYDPSNEVPTIYCIKPCYFYSKEV